MRTLLTLIFCLMMTSAFAETYTGKAENVRQNERGIAFTVVVVDSQGKEVLRREQWVSTGVMTGLETISAIKNVVDRMTQEVYAHIEGAKQVLTKKTELEVYRASCNTYVPPELRPSPADTRIE